MHSDTTVRQTDTGGISRRGEGGFTLIEICVAIAIVALGILTAMSILVPALRWAGDARRELTVGQTMMSAMDDLNSGISYLAPGDVGEPSDKQYGALSAFAMIGGGTQLPANTLYSPVVFIKPRVWDPATSNYSATTANTRLIELKVALFRE